MNCPNCGTSNANGTNFCISCGTALPKEAVQPVAPAPVPVAEPTPVYPTAPVYAAPAAPVAPVAPAAPANEPKSGSILTQLKDTVASVFKPLFANKNLVTAIIGIVALVLVAAIVCGIFVPTEKTPVKDLINITLKGDFDKLEKMLPKDYLEWVEDELDSDIDDLIKAEEESADHYMEALENEYGDNIRISIKITDKKELSKKKLNDIKDNLKEIGINKKDVKKAVKLSVDYTIKGSDDKDEDDFKVVVVKIGGKWYAITDEGHGFLTSAFDFLGIRIQRDEKNNWEIAD